jgi:hypothetical protein
MAMLCANVDPIRAKMLGRWRSDEMLTYLTMQASPMIAGLSTRMLAGGDYQIVPGQDVPAAFNVVAADAVNEQAAVGNLLHQAAQVGHALADDNPNAPP